MRIEEDGVVIESSEDIINGDNGVECACGNSHLTMVAHMDGRKEYASVYNCKCGNVIKVTRRRSREDMMWW